MSVELTLLSVANTTYMSYYWTILTYTAILNSSDYFNSTARYQFGPKDNYTYYNYNFPGFSVDCPSYPVTNLVNCRYTCNKPIYGITQYDWSGCKCYFDETVLADIQCTVQIECSLVESTTAATTTITALTNPTSTGTTTTTTSVSYTAPTTTYSYDSVPSYSASSNLDLNKTSASCYEPSQQYMYSCKYRVIIASIGSNWTDSDNYTEYNMVGLVAFGTSGEGVITTNNKSIHVNSSYTTYSLQQSCTVPDQAVIDANAYNNGSNRILIEYSAYCFSVKCPTIDTSGSNWTCTKMKVDNDAYNFDMIVGTTVTYYCNNNIWNMNCYTPYKVLKCLDTGKWNDTPPTEQCVYKYPGTWSSWSTVNCTLVTWDVDPVTNQWVMVNLNLSLPDCESMNQSSIQSVIDATINSRNQATQEAVQNIADNLKTTLNQLTQKYQTSTNIASSGSILVGILMAFFITFIISSDLVRVIAFILDTRLVREFMNHFEVREMRPSELAARWKRRWAGDNADFCDVSEVGDDGGSVVTHSTSLSNNNFSIADHDLQIRVQRAYRPVQPFLVPSKKTPAKNNKNMNLSIIDI